MGVFENYKEVNGKIRDVGWIEWVHPGIPNSPEIARWLARIFAMIFGHCLNCTALSGCKRYFIAYFKTKSLCSLFNREVYKLYIL